MYAFNLNIPVWLEMLPYIWQFGPRRRVEQYNNLVVWYGIAIHMTMYMHTTEILADFNLWVERHTAKSSNLIPRQIFLTLHTVMVALAFSYYLL